MDIFRAFPEVLAQYQQRFQYLLVDEYQDTNHAQYMLVKLLAAAHRNVFVVGDADQSVYAFRGADMRNILDFEKDYDDATIVLLEQNYRSTQTILDAANAVIRQQRVAGSRSGSGRTRVKANRSPRMRPATSKTRRRSSPIESGISSRTERRCPTLRSSIERTPRAASSRRSSSATAFRTRWSAA